MEASPFGAEDVRKYEEEDYTLLTIPEVGSAQLLTDIYNPDTVDLLTIEVTDPDRRSRGFGKLLFHTAVAHVKDTHDYFGATIANERTAHFFGSTFGEKNIEIYKYNVKRDQYERQAVEYPDVMDRLHTMRSKMSKKAPEGAILPSGICYFLAPLVVVR